MQRLECKSSRNIVSYTVEHYAKFLTGKMVYSFMKEELYFEISGKMSRVTELQTVLQRDFMEEKLDE